MICQQCNVVLLDEAMSGEAFGHPLDNYCLECHASRVADTEQEDALAERGTTPYVIWQRPCRS